MTEHAIVATATVEPPKAVTLVDCDVHMMPTWDMLLPHMGTRARQHVERFGLRAPATPEFYPQRPGLRVDARPDKPGVAPGNDIDKTREQLLDEWGVDYAILLPMAAANSLDCYELPEIAADYSRAVNDCAWEWLRADDRFRGSISLPHKYPTLAVREIERCAVDDRWSQVLLPSTNAQEPFGNPDYWPIYEAAAAHGLPVGYHLGGYQPHMGAGWPSYYLEEHTAYAITMQSTLLSLVCSGAFEAVPDLKVVMVEGGMAWSAGMQAALDDAWYMLGEASPHLKQPPSEYFHDHVWFTSQPIEEPGDPKDLVTILEHGRMFDRLMFSSDYPHWDFDSPAQALPSTLSKPDRAAILAGNACALYGLTPHGEG